jgi:nucleoside-diphosphate-sugar epimerase
MTAVLVTGANGFIGRAMCGAAVLRGFSVRGATRVPAALPSGSENVVVGGVDGATDWRNALKGSDSVIHLASRVHVMRDDAGDPLAEFRKVNVAGTLNLAKQAAEAGVRRFVFLSSIKVSGESSPSDRPFSADDLPAPEDAYSISKFEAEKGVFALARETGMEVVVIRSPLVYGPGVKANFRSMLTWLAKGIPLPLGAVVDNRRSLVGLDNLVDLVLVCLLHPAAANQVFLVSDGEDVSTAGLLRGTAAAMGKRAWLIPVPVKLLELGGSLLCKGDMVRRLCGNLQVDISKTRELLGWRPPFSQAEGLRRTAQAFLHEKAV